jgi:LuxR family transcriptional regulator, quorum-sensing system regulator BjaR1
MDSNRFDYGRDAFAFIDELNRLGSSADVIAALRKALNRAGFEYFCFYGFPKPDQKFDEAMLAAHLPPRWLELYLSENYAQIDHTIRFSKQTNRPFEWKSVPYDVAREPRTANLVRRVNDFGLAGGYCIPIPGPRGMEGGVWMGGSKTELSSDTKPVLHLTALYAFERLRSILNWEPGKRTVLTPREREVLAWAAQGKSAWEIGEILNIAKRTVDEHARNSFHKLGAANRTQAVAVALREHLIPV